MASRPLLCYFNPRLREGGDAILRDKLDYLGEDFNPRLREGGDDMGVPGCLSTQHFNPRLREGGDCINYQFLHLIQSIPCIDLHLALQINVYTI